MKWTSTEWLMISLILVVAETQYVSVALGDDPVSTLAAPRLAPDQTTEVFVLATPHLAGLLPKNFDLKKLGPVLDRLEHFAPDLVAVEQLSGQRIRDYRGNAPALDDVLHAFAEATVKLGEAARRTLSADSLPPPKAAEQWLEKMRGKPREEITVSDRKKAALLFSAADERASAVLQWSYVPAEHRRAGDGVSQEVAERLSAALEDRNEVVVLGIELAKRMRLDRIHGVDDQSDALFQIQRGESLMGELAKSPEFARLQNSEFFAEYPKRWETLLAAGETLTLYRWVNSTEYAVKDVDAQWHFFYRTKLPSGDDLRRAQLWEVRNLCIAAEIRRVTAEEKSRRALVIIGASHKPFLDEYLSSLMDVRVVAASRILGD